jgi:hypothetical protein
VGADHHGKPVVMPFWRCSADGVAAVALAGPAGL